MKQNRAIRSVCVVAILCLVIGQQVVISESERICGYTIIPTEPQCEKCPCECSACDDNLLSTEKWQRGIYECMRAPNQLCADMRKGQSHSPSREVANEYLVL